MMMVSSAGGLRGLYLLFATTSVIAGIAGGAAPTAAQIAPAAAEDQSGIRDSGDVIVTAQRRAERLRDVPIAITALTADDIEKRGATRLQDLQFAIPGLWSVETSPGSERLQIRGISQQAGLPTVATYVDELNMNPNAVTGGTVIRAVDLERIEVLKGPQPTLYGEDSMGGTIRYLTANPDLETIRVRGTAEVGSVNKGDIAYRGEGGVSVPIAPGVFAVRLSGGYEYTGGFIDTPRGNDVNGTRYTTIRGKALLRTGPFEASAMYMHQSWVQRDADYARDDLTYSYPNSYAQPQRGRYDAANVILNYDAGPVKLMSSTGYFSVFGSSDVFFPFSYYSPVPLPNGPITLVQTNSTSRSVGTLKRWTQEFRLTSNTSGPLRYVIGATYTDDKTTSGAAVPPYPAVVPLSTGQSSRAWAVYGEGAYTFGPATLTLGARYYVDRRSDATRQNFQTFRTFNPRVNLSVKTGDSGIIYANVAKGFRSGGYNNPALIVYSSEKTYAPEKLWTYEAGFKQSLLGRSLSIEGAIYYHDYTNIQSVAPPNNGAPQIGRTLNSGNARGWGQELSIVARPDKHLTATFTVGHNDLKYNVGSLIVQKGDPLDNVPKFTWSAAVDYTHPVSDTASFFLNASLGDTSGYLSTLRIAPLLGVLLYNGDPLTSQIKVKGRTVIDARTGVDFGKFSLFVFGENLTNDVNATYAGGVIQTAEGARPRPRTVGAGLSFKM